MAGGISSAIQARIDLYRQNSDIDLLVDEKELSQLIEILIKLGYDVEDKRNVFTNNFIDTNGDFHAGCHDINANIHSSEMLGVGIFVFEKRNGSIIQNIYAYDERESAFIGMQKLCL